jgi:hypothetical protein
MCRSNVIIYQNETKFEIYCNDKTESHHITYNISFIGRGVRKSNNDVIEISCSPMKRQTIISISDFLVVKSINVDIWLQQICTMSI